jgi:hypothetical protein
MTVNGELVRRKTMAQRTPLPGFGSRRLRQELGAEGAWSQGAPYGLDGRHRGGSAVAASGERSGRHECGSRVERERKSKRERRKWRRLLHCSSMREDKADQPTWGGGNRRRGATPA